MTARKKVYCPVLKLMFWMQGTIKDGSSLQEFHARSCENGPKCTQMNDVNCRVHKVIQTGKW